MMNKKTSYQSRAVVTGAGSGIGKAFALELAQRGGRVICADIDIDAAHQTASQIKQAGAQALAVKCDVSKLAEFQNLAEKSEQWLGEPANLLINNAGVGVGGERVEDISLNDWQWIMNINLWGVIYGCQVFTPQLRALGEGGIINVASAASFGAAPRMGAYNTTKAGVLALSETMAAELSGSGVKISVLCPTFVKTDIFKHARVETSLINLGEKLMNKTGLTASQVAVKTLNDFDKGKLHILPQTDAKLSWMSKRISPGLFTYGMGMVSRYFPKTKRSLPHQTSNAIPIRHANFSFDGSKMSKYCWDDNAFSSAFILTFSALIPHGEKFVIESMREYRDQIADPELKSHITSLIGQEAMHSKVHDEFNRIYQEKGLPLDKISKLGEWYFEKHLPAILPKPARLAVTCAIEHFTAMMAERSFNDIEKVNYLDVGAREFLTWHLIEEAEHKSVAFDVYQHAVDSYWLRVLALVFITAYTSTLFAWSIQEIMRTPGYSKGAKKDAQGFLYWFGTKGYFATLQSQLRKYMRKDFHPNQIDTTVILEEWSEKLFGEQGELTPFIQKTITPSSPLSNSRRG